MTFVEHPRRFYHHKLNRCCKVPVIDTITRPQLSLMSETRKAHLERALAFERIVARALKSIYTELVHWNIQNEKSHSFRLVKHHRARNSGRCYFVESRRSRHERRLRVDGRVSRSLASAWLRNTLISVLVMNSSRVGVVFRLIMKCPVSWHARRYFRTSKLAGRSGETSSRDISTGNISHDVYTKRRDFACVSSR